MDVMVRTTGLVKSYGDFVAVDDVSLAVKKGEILGVLGVNGAGKTTTMKMLTGFLAADSGQIEICGDLVTTDNLALRRKIGYLPEGAPLYGEMTPREFLSFIAHAHAIPNYEIPDVVSSAADAVNILNVFDQKIGTLSKGYKRRVAFAGAILHAPDVLILDEPTDGLDPNQKFEMRRLIEAMSVERAIIISTHILEEVEALCGRVVVMNDGQIVADGTPSEMRSLSEYRNAVMMLIGHEDAERVAMALSNLRYVKRVEAIAEGPYMRLTVVPFDQNKIDDQVAELASISRWHVQHFSVDHGRLEDVFRTLTQTKPE